jgi:hypothetical protein
MSFLTARPGILVVGHLSGRSERMRQHAPAVLSPRFAGGRIHKVVTLAAMVLI